MKRLICITLVAFLLNIYCYADDNYSKFEVNTGFIVEEIDVNYSNDDFIDYQVYSCDKNGILIYADNLNRDARYVYIDYNGNVTEYDLSEKEFASAFNKPIVFNEGMACACYENKWGYIDEDYQWIVPPIYSNVTDFSSGYGSVSFDSKSYLINKDGKICICADSIFKPFFSNKNSVFANEYAVYEKDGDVYYLDKDLNSIKIDIGDTSNHNYHEYFYEGGTLVYAYYTKGTNGINHIGYRVLNHDGKVSYEYKSELPIEYFYLLSDFLEILSSGVVLFEELESPEEIVSYDPKSKHVAVSVSGEVLGETDEIYTSRLHKVIWSIDDKIINFANIYDANLNKIGETKWSVNNDYRFFSDDGDVFGDIVVSKNGENSSAKIEKIRLIRGKDTSPKGSVKLVDMSRVSSVQPDKNEIVSVYLNNKQIEFDADPITENDRTLVPMRAIFEALGADVTWNDETNTATAIKDGITVSVTIDSDIMLRNGEEITLDAPARLIDDSRTLVPLRAVSEAFDCIVNWSGELQRVDILE